MKCPKCGDSLNASDLGEYGFVIVDVCPECQGAWLDKGELDRLDNSVWTNVEELDFSKVPPDHKDITCPKCGKYLEAVSPTDATELTVDRCLSCQGFWLDKGELEKMRDLATEKDSEEQRKMILVQRPKDWSYLRWCLHCFKESYFR